MRKKKKSPLPGVVGGRGEFCYTGDMDLSSALSIYKLNNAEFSRDDLDRGFKGLVKKYHPDRNQNFSDWCHIRMTEINEAYEILMASLESRPPKENRTQESRMGNAPPRADREEISLRKGATLFFTGVHIYYDYELTKRSLRQEGVWRYHYKRAIKLMEKALEHMEKHLTPHSGHGEKFLYFGQLFLCDIQSFDPQIPLSLRGSKTHVAYREATEMIDRAFSDYFSSNSRDREKYLTPLYRASHLLILLIENYPRTEWYALALQKLNLLDSFLDLQDLFRMGIIGF